jgi:hypothetical protein
MSDEGFRLLMRAALIGFMIITAACIKVFVGPSKKRSNIMMVGGLAGYASGVLLSYPLYDWFQVEASVLLAVFGAVLGSAVAWRWARHHPREST